MQSSKIYTRNDGRYEMRLYTNGKCRSVYGSTKTEVKDKYKKLKKEVEHQQVLDKSGKLGDAMTRYLYDIKRTSIKASSFDRVESTFVTHIASSDIAKQPYNRISPEAIQALLDEKHYDGCSASTTDKIYDILNEFFKHCLLRQDIQFNPMMLVNKPKSDRESSLEVDTEDFDNVEIFSVDEASRIVHAAESVDEKGRKKYRYGEAIVLLLHTGLRNGELRALKLESIDLEKKELTVTRNVVRVKNRVTGKRENKISKPKSKKSLRRIPLNDRAVEAIKILIDTTYDENTGYLITTENGNILSHNLLQRAFDRVLKAADLEHKGLHALRHTFATIMLKDGTDKGRIKEVSEMLGHSSVWVTYQYYIATSHEQKHELVQPLVELLS